MKTLIYKLTSIPVVLLFVAFIPDRLYAQGGNNISKSEILTDKDQKPGEMPAEINSNTRTDNEEYNIQIIDGRKVIVVGNGDAHSLINPDDRTLKENDSQLNKPIELNPEK
ncbi:MAG: hypothetical protein HYY40_12435 [Bacteroidetes bacterium]|nr:hypothetical protein [Bacteroidota bacterium]